MLELKKVFNNITSNQKTTATLVHKKLIQELNLKLFYSILSVLTQ